MAAKQRQPTRIWLFHWHEAEAVERAAGLRQRGFDARVTFRIQTGLRRSLGEWLPDAAVIDLARMPSHGREVALYLRRTRSLQNVRLVFVGGEPDKVAKIRALLPEAAYADWPGVRAAIREALAAPVSAPPPPGAYMDRWAATPLVKKLGIEPGMTVALVNAPEGFEDLVSSAEGVTFVANPAAPAVKLTFIFARTADELALFADRALGKMKRPARLWICWPKPAGGKAARDGLGMPAVRETARYFGLAEAKIASIDREWSGIKFVFA